MTKVTIKTAEQLVEALEGARTISAVEAILADSSVRALRSYAKAEGFYFCKPLPKVTKDELVSAILGSFDGVFETEESEVGAKSEAKLQNITAEDTLDGQLMADKSLHNIAVLRAIGADHVKLTEKLTIANKRTLEYLTRALSFNFVTANNSVSTIRAMFVNEFMTMLTREAYDKLSVIEKLNALIRKDRTCSNMEFIAKQNEEDTLYMAYYLGLDTEQLYAENERMMYCSRNIDYLKRKIRYAISVRQKTQELVTEPKAEIEEAEVSGPEFKDFPSEYTKDSEKQAIINHNFIEVVCECKSEAELKAFFMKCKNVETLQEMARSHYGRLPAIIGTSVKIWAEWFTKEFWPDLTEMRLRREDEIRAEAEAVM